MKIILGYVQRGLSKVSKHTARSCGKDIQAKQCQCCGRSVQCERTPLGSLLVLLTSPVGRELWALEAAEKGFNPGFATYSVNLGLCVCYQFFQHLKLKTLKASYWKLSLFGCWPKSHFL